MQRSYDLAERTVLVTGASSGLGRALARAYASAGAKVGICARTEPDILAAAEEIRAAGGSVEPGVVNVTDEAAVHDWVGRVRQRFGSVDALVNNASVLGERVPLADYPIESWRSVLDVNVTGALIASQAVLPGMRAAGGGSIVNVSSGVGGRPRARWGAYGVSKWGIEALTYNLALEEAEHGVRVNAVDPGAMRTDMRRAAYPDEDPDTLPRPREVVDVFLWLASGESASTTGERLEAQGWTPPSRRA